MKTKANPLRKKGMLQNSKGVFGPRKTKKRKETPRNNFSNAKGKRKRKKSSKRK